MTSKTLSVAERFLLMSVLPQEGDFATIKMLRDLVAKVGFSDEEHAEFKFQREELEGGRAYTKWDDKAAKDKDIEFSDPEIGMVVDALKKLDGEKKLTAQHLSLCEKFDFAAT